MIRRILILGLPASGKTTLARRLADQAGLPHVEGDALYWLPDGRENPAFLRQAQEAVGTDNWVFEGHYSKLKDILLPRAQCIVWLKPPWILVLIRFVRRWVRGPKRGGTLMWLLTHRASSERLFREAIDSARSSGVLAFVSEPGFSGDSRTVENEIRTALGIESSG